MDSVKREQLEANWGWSPTEGSIPFKRPRITDKNIKDQRKLARPGTLIHWVGKPCPRGVKKVDQTTETSGKATITHTALASHIENVNCLQCRKRYFDRKQRKD